MFHSRFARSLIAMLLLAAMAGPYLLNELAGRNAADSPVAICEYEKELGEEKQSEVEFGLFSKPPAVLDLEPSWPVEIHCDLEGESHDSLLYLSRGPPMLRS